MSKRIPKKYRHITTKEQSERIIHEAIQFKKIHGYAYLIIEKCTQFVLMYEALWACQMRSRQSVGIHNLYGDYYEIKDVHDFINRTGKTYG